MKKTLTRAFIVSAIIIGILVTVLVLWSKGKRNGTGSEQLDLLTDSLNQEEINEAASEHMKIGKDADILAFDREAIDDIYSVVHSRKVTKRIDKLKKQTHYTFEKPLLIWNPYGTNELSLYDYFRDEESTYVKYSIHVDDKRIPDYTRILNNHTEKNLTRIHEYQITGFVPGYQNYLQMWKYNEKGKLLKKLCFDFYVDKLGENVKTKILYQDGKSSQTISAGLYCICGYEPGRRKSPKIIPFYDNSGIIRSAIPIKNYRTDRMEEVYGNLVYSYSGNAFAEVTPLGQVKRIYKLGRYKLYHDFIYNDYGQLWCLATDSKSDTVGDQVVSVEMKSGKVTRLVDFKALYPKIKQRAAKAVKARPLNWIDLNSITRVGSSDIVVSSRELSSIMKVRSITCGYPKRGYIISNAAIWKKTNYKKYLLLKGAYIDQKWYNLDGSTKDLGEEVHKFSSQFGQNSVTCEQGYGLTEGQYYLTLFNNNYGYSKTLKQVKWGSFHGVGTRKRAADCSYYYEYIVDENAGYYGLKRSFVLPYSEQGGNVYWNGTNTISSSMGNKVFGEYDNTGKMIREYDLRAYRVYKNDMKNIWYY